MSFVRVVRTFDPESITPARPGFGDVPVPYKVSLFAKSNPPELGLASRRKEAEINGCGVFAEQREVHAAAVPGCAERIWRARVNPEGFPGFLFGGGGSFVDQDSSPIAARLFTTLDPAFDSARRRSTSASSVRRWSLYAVRKND